MRTGITVIILICCLFLLIWVSTVDIPEDSAGVQEIKRSLFGLLDPGLKQAPLMAGRHISLPFVSEISVYKIKSRLLKLELTFDELPDIKLPVSARLSINPAHIADIQRKHGKNFMEDIIRPTIQSLLKREFRSRPETLPEGFRNWDEYILSKIAPALSAEGVVLDHLIFEAPLPAKVPRPAAETDV